MRTLQLGVAALPLLMSKALLLPFSRAVIFQPSNLGNIMPDLATLNSTMGHPNILWSLGLGYNPDIQDAASVSTSLDESSEDEDEVDESTQFIPITEMTEALGVALRLSEASMEDIKAEGWNLVFSSPLISLLKRRVKKAGRNPGPVEYLMLGRVTDVSPRTFLHAQINRQSRARWDRTMKTMEVPGDPLAEADGLVKGSKRSQDTLYYRTKWPWPLKDRDYTLARRCRLFADKNAFVLVSKSTEVEGYPAIDGVIRVDSYWCHSTIIADNSSNNESEGVKGDVDSPGLRFVTLFCDDQRVPLPAALVDIISAQGEKVVPGAIERLHEVAYQIQQQQQPNRSS